MMPFPDTRYTFEWDVDTWSQAALFWDKWIQAHHPRLAHGLELGAHNGGMSCLFAARYESKMVCSDLDNPAAPAQERHKALGISQQITYQAIDATTLPFPDETFDFVVFKSMLGVIAAYGNTARLPVVFQEIHRVLKPGGVVFLAENMRATLFHRKARQWFVPWGKNWHYLSLRELQHLLDVFRKKNCKQPVS